jgi:hypothetical protein
MKKKILLIMPLMAMLMSSQAVMADDAADPTSQSVTALNDVHVWDYMGADRISTWVGLGGTESDVTYRAVFQQVWDNLYYGGNGLDNTLQDYARFGCFQFNGDCQPSRLMETAPDTYKEDDGFLSFKIPAGEKGKVVARLYSAQACPDGRIDFVVQSASGRNFSAIEFKKFSILSQSVEGDPDAVSSVYLGKSLWQEILKCYLLAWVPEKAYNNVVTVGSTGLVAFMPNVNVNIPEGVNVYYVSKVDVTGATLTQLDPMENPTIPAFNAVIVEAKPGQVTFPIADDGIVEDLVKTYKNVLSGADRAMTIPTDNNTYYTLGELFDGSYGFVKVAAGTAIPACGAYFSGATNTYDAVDELPLNVNIGIHTGVKTAQADGTTSDNAYYNLQGVKVDKSAKGVLIHNGKKEIFK